MQIPLICNTLELLVKALQLQVSLELCLLTYSSRSFPGLGTKTLVDWVFAAVLLLDARTGVHYSHRKSFG